MVVIVKKKFTSFAATVVVAALGPAGMASGSDGRDDDEGVIVREVNVFPANWTLTSAQCSLLPPGTTLTGSGTLTDKKSTETEHGTIEEIYDDFASGTAVDQNGKTYSWTYDNYVKVENDDDNQTLFTGRMSDTFRLKGTGSNKGRIKLRNGFDATVVDDRLAGTFEINPKSSYGDPFNFPLGPGRCDPL